jgi:hypothetical protein
MSSSYLKTYKICGYNKLDLWKHVAEDVLWKILTLLTKFCQIDEKDEVFVSVYPEFPEGPLKAHSYNQKLNVHIYVVQDHLTIYP